MEKTSLHPILPEADVQALVANYLADPIFDNRQVLVLIPDHTRTGTLAGYRRYGRRRRPLRWFKPKQRCIAVLPMGVRIRNLHNANGKDVFNENRIA